MKYTKRPFTVDEHIALLKSRGLIISDEARAEKYLRTTGYFRLTGYMHHLQNGDGSHQFQGGVCLDDVILHYQFDKKLRGLFIDYLERIEVAVKAKLTDKFCLTHGFYWYRNPDLFANVDVYAEINKEIQKRFDQAQERYLKSYKLKYILETCPPSNMAMEILSFGKLSRLYEGLKNGEEKMAIASDLHLVSSILSSWLNHLTNVRNVCAHHSRLWNRRFTADRPVIPSRKEYRFPGDLPQDFNATVYGVICIINRVLCAISPGNTFVKKIITLIDAHPRINPYQMGFPIDWRNNAAWK